jgi:hypothetical protein
MLEYCIDDLRDLQLSSLPCIGDGITESLKYPRIRSHYGLSASLDSCQQQVTLWIGRNSGDNSINGREHRRALET